MALTTAYTIVPFRRGSGGELLPSAPRQELDQATAIDTARRLVPFYAGVIVLIERSDLAAGMFLEPVLTFSAGEVPADLRVEGLPP